MNKNDKALRSELIKLAHAQPNLRSHLLPLIKKADDDEDEDDKGKEKGKGKVPPQFLEHIKEKGDGEKKEEKKAFMDKTMNVMGTLALTKDGSLTFMLTGRGGTIPTLVGVALRRALLQRKIAIGYDTGTLTVRADPGAASPGDILTEEPVGL